MTENNHWIKKLVASTLMIAGITGSFISLLSLLPLSWTSLIEESFWSLVFQLSNYFSIFPAAIFTFYWHRRSHSDTDWSKKIMLKFNALIRYSLAFEISTYAFAKLMGTQFGTNFSTQDVTMGAANGFMLTWNYFGYSYTMACIIAFVQLTGSFLLTFRKTTLAGSLLLLPVMINIVLINLFYDISPDALLNAVKFSLGLIYLTTEHFTSISKILFIQPHPELRLAKPWFKWIARLMTLLVAFMIIENFLMQDPMLNTKAVGSWNVLKMTRNHDSVHPDSWIKDATTFKKVYFEKRFGMITLCPNPYVFEEERSKIGTCMIDDKSGVITGSISSFQSQSTDTLEGKITFFKSDSCYFNGVIGTDSIEMWMKRIKTQ